MLLLSHAIIYAKEHSMNKKSMTIGGGCFWCLDAVFNKVKGVSEVICGYSGGSAEEATYQKVSMGKTSHIEVVQISFDSAVISYETLLEIFWKIHDPTTLNRQGNDVGTQYRSVIFYHDALQKEKALASLEHQRERYTKPIVTSIEPLGIFYTAEAYHQDYFTKHPYEGYCSMVIAPKVKHFKEWYEKG